MTVGLERSIQRNRAIERRAVARGAVKFRQRVNAERLTVNHFPGVERFAVGFESTNRVRPVLRPRISSAGRRRPSGPFRGTPDRGTAGRRRRKSRECGRSAARRGGVFIDHQIVAEFPRKSPRVHGPECTSARTAGCRSESSAAICERKEARSADDTSGPCGEDTARGDGAGAPAAAPEAGCPVAHSPGVPVRAKAMMNRFGFIVPQDVVPEFRRSASRRQELMGHALPISTVFCFGPSLL